VVGPRLTSVIRGARRRRSSSRRRPASQSSRRTALLIAWTKGAGDFLSLAGRWRGSCLSTASRPRGRAPVRFLRKEASSSISATRERTRRRYGSADVAQTFCRVVGERALGRRVAGFDSFFPVKKLFLQARPAEGRYHPTLFTWHLSPGQPC
jgi:hypothetical protein